MTIAELIEMLEAFDGEQEVRVAYQPSYPMEVGITDVVEASDEEESKSIVYIGTQSHNDYLPGEASEQLGWR